MTFAFSTSASTSIFSASIRRGSSLVAPVTLGARLFRSRVQLLTIVHATPGPGSGGGAGNGGNDGTPRGSLRR